MLRKMVSGLLVVFVVGVAVSGVLAAVNTTSAAGLAQQVTTALPDTGQGTCYDNMQPVACPQEGAAFYGQDAQYAGAQPSYTDNGDGTVTDNVTGLMWQASPDTNGDGAITAADKLSYDEALAGADAFTLAGYDDWRLPTITELYSLILFDGQDLSGLSSGQMTVIPFIDSSVFDFAYGDTDAGERLIDSQFASSTLYVSTTNGQRTLFGVNFADGRIKGYGTGALPGRTGDKTFFVLYVRGNPDYGVNDFVDNDDGTITDQATGLMWMQSDSGAGMSWAAALDYCESLSAAGYADWRLPNAKELQSLVDYSRSPDTTGSAAIDPLFSASVITNEAGQRDYSAYWSSTTHANLSNGGNAVYVSFGRALGYMGNAWIDIHGAGAQRSDPKTGDASQWPTGHGPQGDAIRIDNYVRCVRAGSVTADPDGNTGTTRQGVTVTTAETSASGQNEMSGPAGQGQQPPQSEQSGAAPQGGGAGGPAGVPPQEALTACSGSSEGSACQFTTLQSTITGSCLPVADGQLACVPADGPPAR